MIFIVAPYSIIGRQRSQHLGAARKLETIIGLLSQLSSNIVLINTSHDEIRSTPLQIKTIQVNNTNVYEITPPCFSKRKIGKLLNLLQLEQVIDAAIGLGMPSLVWLYNGYAFESLFAVAIRKMTSCPIVLEFEDWHFSRGRGFNPKPYIDFVTWRKAMSVATHAYTVNAELAKKVARYSVPTNLLPGIVPATLAAIACNSPPFTHEQSLLKIGFFGGLSAEKGVDTLLELIELLPAGFQLLMSGSGPLEGALRDKAERFPDRLAFHGRVSDDRLYELISECDVILNPHHPIAAMSNGIFPFKVIEAIASGRVLVSTSVPGDGLEDLLQGVRFYDGSINELIEAITTTPAYYKQHQATIQACAIATNDRFGESALLASISQILNQGVHTQ